MGVEIKSGQNFTASHIKSLVNKSQFVANIQNHKNIILAIVARNETEVEKILGTIPLIDFSNAKNVALLIGYISKFNQGFRNVYFK